jgi:tetratricopeptide (TPR) repeat protein
MPQKALADEINKVKLFRKRRDILKEEINWVYDTREAQFYSQKFGKPILAYQSNSSGTYYQPSESFFQDYSIIKKINSSYIPLYVKNKPDRTDLKTGYPELAVMNSYGDIIYNTIVPEEIQTLSIFLDYRTNSNLCINLGSKGYIELQKRYETIKSLISNKLKLSSENELLSFLTKYPSFSYAYIDLGRHFLDHNDFSKSVHYLRFLQDRIFDLSENFLQIMVSSCMLYDDYYRLNEFLNTIKLQNKNNPLYSASIYSALSEVSMSESNTLEAISYADSAYSIDPKRTDNAILLGMLNYNINKKKSESYFKSAIVLDPDNLVANSYLFRLTMDNKYSVTARRSYHSGKSDFTGLTYFDPSKHFGNKGLLEFRERSHRIRLSLFPDNQDFMLELAKFITDTGGNLPEALEITNRLLTISPNDPEYLSTAAWVFYNLGDFSGADKLITKALISLPPDEFYKYPELFYYIGMIKSAIGDNRTAAYYFETLLGFKNKNDIDFNKLIYAERFIDSIH